MEAIELGPKIKRVEVPYGNLRLGARREGSCRAPASEVPPRILAPPCSFSPGLCQDQETGDQGWAQRTLSPLRHASLWPNIYLTKLILPFLLQGQGRRWAETKGLDLKVSSDRERGGTLGHRQE